MAGLAPAQPLDGNYRPAGGGAITPGTGFVVPKTGLGTGVDAVTGFTYGTLEATPVDGQKATYAATVVGLLPVTTSTDIANIGGSATKLIRVTRVIVSGVLTAAAVIDVLLIKRGTAADSAGTIMPAVPYDSNSPAATATVYSYTANPATLGTAIGTIFAAKLGVPTPANSPGADRLIADLGNRPASAGLLRGVLQSIGVSLNGLVTVTGGLFSITIEWTEE